jgi:hypothetical protein
VDTRKKSAMNELRGTWEESFSMLWRFKVSLEETCLGSIVETDFKKINGQMHFSRMVSRKLLEMM